MALPHTRPGQVVDLLPNNGAALPTEGSYALFKSAQLELIRLALPAGKRFPSHAVAGEITVQCLSGAIAFELDGRELSLRAGQLLHLEGGVPHALRGVEDATALLTIVLRAG